MKRAIFGGTFDPIHNAHLAVAREARDRFALDEVLFVPAATPPHKPVNTGFAHRARMAELAIAGEAGLAVSRIEEHREQSYSILTIEELRAADPGCGFYFLIGADAFSEIETWFRWRDVIRAIGFIVVSRPGHVYDIPEGARVLRLETLAMDVSSTRIRREFAAGRVPGEVPGPVARYVLDHGLYGCAKPDRMP